jgi:hypothetical protein
MSFHLFHCAHFFVGAINQYNFFYIFSHRCANVGVL